MAGGQRGLFVRDRTSLHRLTARQLAIQGDPGNDTDQAGQISTVITRVTIRQATKREAKALQILEGSPSHRIHRVTRSITGRAFEVTTRTLVDRYVLVCEIPTGVHS